MIQQYKSKYLSVHVFLTKIGVEHRIISQIDEGKYFSTVIQLDTGIIRSHYNELIKIPFTKLHLHNNGKLRIEIHDIKKFNDSELMKIDNFMLP